MIALYNKGTILFKNQSVFYDIALTKKKSLIKKIIRFTKVSVSNKQ